MDRLFAEWNDTPIASASIGQVHRAILLDEREVAVKVQHPGVAEAVESDLRNAGLVESTLAMMGTRRLDSKRVLEEVRARFREELDYSLEGERQIAFARLHVGDPHIHIPSVIGERTSKRVLTTAFVRGEIALFRSSGVILNPFFSFVSRITGVASARATIGG